MKVLFSHSYYYPLDDKQWKKKQPYPPLGTIQAASTIRQKGFEVDLFDTNLISDPNLIIPKLDTFQPEVLVLYDDGFNYLTKMCLTNMRNAAFQMINLANERGIKVVVSSSDSTDQYASYLDSGAEVVLLGEADETLSELLYNWKEEESHESIKGIAFKQSDKVISNGRRAVLKDLDQLPMPAWDLINIEPYRQIWLEGNGYFSLNLATTRGCPFKCNWCAKPIYGNRYNSRSPHHVVNEIEYLIQNFKPDHFWMCDDIFGLKPGWVQEFDVLLKEKSLQIKYTIQSRVDLLLKEDTIDALASSGAHEIWVGAESGSQKVLDAMDKGTDVQDIYDATRMLKSKGIRIAFFLQFGYPEETKEDIQKTVNMVTELMPDNIGVSVSYPLPGTPFYDRVKSELTDKQNWEDSDDLDLMFANTYPKDFYRRLQRYVHRKLRLKQGFQLKGFRAIALLPYYFVVTKLDKIALDRMEAKS